MRKSRFTQEQIAFALRQVEGGTPVGEVCRKMGISENTFYRWKRKFDGLGVAEIRRRLTVMRREMPRRQPARSARRNRDPSSRRGVWQYALSHAVTPAHPEFLGSTPRL